MTELFVLGLLALFPILWESIRGVFDHTAVNWLGVDTASIDYGPSKDFIVHRIAGVANVIGLENVAKLNKLPPSGAWIIALPIKITGGSGGPTRIVSLVPKK